MLVFSILLELLDLSTQNPNHHLIELDNFSFLIKKKGNIHGMNLIKKDILEVNNYGKLPEVVETVECVTNGIGINLLVHNSGLMDNGQRDTGGYTGELAVPL